MEKKVWILKCGTSLLDCFKFDHKEKERNLNDVKHRMREEKRKNIKRRDGFHEKMLRIRRI